MKSALREILETVVLTILIFLMVRSAVQNFKVEGHSMEPTLQDGQYLLINKAAYWQLSEEPLGKLLPDRKADANGRVDLFGAPQRGDIIVFQAPQTPQRDFIKRVIGIPGDKVEIKASHVYVNSKALEEPYLSEPPRYETPLTTVPAGSYFVLGDHRNNSSDSHVWGVVKRELIVGKAWVSYWPPASWGTAEHATLGTVISKP